MGLLGQPGLRQAFNYYYIKSYSRDNSVILNNIQAYDLDVELGLFFLSLKHKRVCSTLTAYVITFKSEIVPIEETMNALNKLKKQGKIRAIGVSNFSSEQIAEASQYSRIGSVQPPYSVF